MWCLKTWFRGGLDSGRFVIGLNDLEGHFKSKWFYDSMIGRVSNVELI